MLCINRVMMISLESKSVAIWNADQYTEFPLLASFALFLLYIYIYLHIYVSK
jgi:hypothetical protein